MESIKCVIVGDGAIGKTSMLISYTTDSFPTEYVPTVFDNYQTTVMVDAKPISLGLWDTAGQEDYDRLRPLSYPNSDVFLICYAIDNPISLINIEQKWIPEIRHYCLNAPFIIVGTKSDIRNDEKYLNVLKKKNIDLVSLSDVKKYGEKLFAADVLECSAKTQIGLKRIFDQAIRAALKQRKVEKKQSKNKCCQII